MYTASSLFLHTLAEAGITHAFVNWGSDHPGILEDLERQRIASADGLTTRPSIVTCPNEMVALSAAQGYAQVTGKPAAVIVHVDVGTQALAGAVHNVDRSQTPVLIFAGASPFSSQGEAKGTRNEWIMWYQDIPDQSAIVRQYMRYTAQISSGSTIPQVVRRALQLATSHPKGPVYLWARREVMEEEIPESLLHAPLSLKKWPPIEPCALSPEATSTIASALLSAQSPLIITSHLGRRPRAVPLMDSFSHPNHVHLPIHSTHTPLLHSADVILVIDCILPWIPANDCPSPDARIFVLESADPLAQTIGSWHVDADLICRADAELALAQITTFITQNPKLLPTDAVKSRGESLEAVHCMKVWKLDEEEAMYPNTKIDPTLPPITVPNVMGILRRTVQDLTPSHGRNVLYLNESISNYQVTWTHLRPETPGSMLTSGGSSLGWALGAAVGAHIGGQIAAKGYDLIVAIVGDGSFLFGVPASVYWMARRYMTPFLTIVLNNGGWKSPRNSMLGVHPTGYGSQAPGDKLSVGFGPNCPDYSQIAVAASAGWTWGVRVRDSAKHGQEQLERVIADAVIKVVRDKKAAIIDCIIESM